MLASASADGTVRLWDTRQGRTVRILSAGATASIFSVAWSPDGTKIAAGTLNGSLLLWNAQTGKQIAVLNGPPARQSDGGNYPFAAWGVSWSPDGSHIISTRYDDLVLIWEVATGAGVVIPKTDSQPNTVVWAPDGRHFALTDDAGKVILWNWNGRAAQRSASFGGNDGAGWSNGLTWAPDSSMVASSREAGLAQVWDAQTGKQRTALQGHTDAVWGLAWSPDGLRLASVSDDGTVRLWGVRQ